MIDIFRKLAELSTTGRTAALCTITETDGSTPRKAGSKMIVTGDGKTFGSVGGGMLEQEVIADALAVIKSGAAKQKKYSCGEDNDMHCYGDCVIFLDPLPNNYSLYIFGAGHVGRALAIIARNYGFRISIIDPRQEFIDGLDFDDINGIYSDYSAAIPHLEFNDITFVVVTTPSHESDEEVTLLCAQRPHAYLGMIGSKKKVSLAKEFFAKSGLDKESIQKIDMPIGVPINCETPEEIAVSILARLIDVKNKK